jgi:hypothetical protein
MNMKILKMKSYLSAIIVLLLISACKKEEKSFTQVSGTVYDKGTNKSITAANAQVFFEWRKPLTYAARTYHLDSTLTDAEGRYSVSAETPNEDLHVYANGRQHFPEGALSIGPNVQRGRRQTLNLELIPFAWIRMNITKRMAFDYMNINRPSGSPVNFQVHSDTLLYAKVFGNMEIVINTFKYKNFEQTHEEYFIQSIGRDTVDIYIEF